MAWIARLPLIAFVGLIAQGGARAEGLLRDTAEDTRREVQRLVPLGTSVPEAEALLQAEGLECTFLRDRGFAYHRPGERNPVYHPPADFLWCDSGERRTGNPLVSKRWQVMLLETNGSVSRIEASVGLTGM